MTERERGQAGPGSDLSLLLIRAEPPLGGMLGALSFWKVPREAWSQEAPVLCQGLVV